MMIMVAVVIIMTAVIFLTIYDKNLCTSTERSKRKKCRWYNFLPNFECLLHIPGSHLIVQLEIERAAASDSM